jgi:hypothetical protein
MTQTPQIIITFVAGSTHDLQVETWINGQRILTPLQDGTEILQIRCLLQEQKLKALNAAKIDAAIAKQKDDKRRAKIQDYVREYHPRQLALVMGHEARLKPSSASSPSEAQTEANFLIALATKNDIF